MAEPARVHLIAGGFPPGSLAGHDQDYARLRLLGLLAEREIPASVANDFSDVEKWLAVSRMLITYVAGPYPDAAQCRGIQQWLEAGGRWLGLHGTSGGRAERVEGARQRRTVKTEHHALLGSFFLTHPPICKIRVDVAGGDSTLTRGLGSSFVVEDEPYFIELQDPKSTRILLTADYGPAATSPAIGTLYPSDTSLQPDRKTRVLGYTRDGRPGRRDVLRARPLPQSRDQGGARGRSDGHDAAHVPRLVGERRVHHLAAQRDRVGCRGVARFAPLRSAASEFGYAYLRVVHDVGACRARDGRTGKPGPAVSDNLFRRDLRLTAFGARTRLTLAPSCESCACAS